MSKENGEQRRQIHHPSSFLNNQYYSYYQREKLVFLTAKK